MKSNVTVEELNAATILLTGIPVTKLVEVHIAGSVVTAITADGEGNFNAYRVMIGNPTPYIEEPGVTEGVDTSEDSPEETDGDDGP